MANNIIKINNIQNSLELLDKEGNIKTRNNRLWIKRNSDEGRAHIKQRVQDFPNIMIDLWNRYKVEGVPPNSDSSDFKSNLCRKYAIPI